LWQSKEDENRKVQFTGGSTYIISLPKKWIFQNQLKKGSYIKLREEEGGLLTIVPPSWAVPKKQDQATIVVVPCIDRDVILRKIVSAYLAGYNSIHIKTEKQPLSSQLRHEMKSFVRRMLVGTEIVTDTSSQLVLQVLWSFPELTIQSALRRMTIITVSMHKDAVLGLTAGNCSLAKEVVLADNEVDRFNLYVTRLLRTSILHPRIKREIGVVSSDECLAYRIVTKYVERIADHAVNIAENVLILKNCTNSDITRKIENLSLEAIKMFDTAMESLFRQDYNAAEKIIESIIKIRELEKEAVATSHFDAENGPTLRMIIESIKRTAEYACDIAEIVLNLTIDTVIT